MGLRLRRSMGRLTGKGGEFPRNMANRWRLIFSPVGLGSDGELKVVESWRVLA